MVLFKLAGTILFFLALYPLFSGNMPEDNRAWNPFFQGLFLFIPVVVLWLLIYVPIPAAYRHTDIFLHSFLLEHLFFIFFGGVGAVLFFWLFSGASSPREQGIRLFTFFCGFFVLIGGVEVLYFFKIYDIYYLFTLPILRLGMIIVSVLLFTAAAHVSLWGRVGVLLGLPVYAGINGLISLLDRTQRPIAALALSIVPVVIFLPVLLFLFPKLLFLKKEQPPETP